MGDEDDGAKILSSITIESIITLLRESKNFLLSQDVEKFVRFVSFDNGLLRVNLDDGCSFEIIKKLNEFFISKKYNIKVEHSSDEGEPTVATQKKELFNKQLTEMMTNQMLVEVLATFKNSCVAKIEDL